MSDSLTSAPVLSTPDEQILEHAVEPPARPQRSDEELNLIYDIERTLDEIKQGQWKRIALQFPDTMLHDAPRVFQLLSRGLRDVSTRQSTSIVARDPSASEKASEGGHDGIQNVAHRLQDSLHVGETTKEQGQVQEQKVEDAYEEPQLFILADTSYGTCCVDEIAAEHVSADVVVHYGRSCLSPSARLPVIYVFTHMPLDLNQVMSAFATTYPDKNAAVIVAADVTYSSHVHTFVRKLADEGYTNIFETEIIHRPSSPIPNRTVPVSVEQCPDTLRDWKVFHISEPPSALLLTLSSRVSSIHICPTEGDAYKSLEASTALSLSRRYGLITKLTTASVFGILINTLSVKNYLHIVEHVKAQIAAAGKKCYMFVVGKLNPAKVANFSEIDGWVVIGCWESSMIDNREFWKPIITPFELELVLQGDSRVWTGEWKSDYQALLDTTKSAQVSQTDDEENAKTGTVSEDQRGDEASEEESEPPEFDFATGRLISVSKARPMRRGPAGNSGATSTSTSKANSSSNAMTRRAGTEVATIKGVVSPGAEFLSKRTWRGLGSDFEIRYEDEEEAATVVEGRKGIASRYTVGDDAERR